MEIQSLPLLQNMKKLPRVFTKIHSSCCNALLKNTNEHCNGTMAFYNYNNLDISNQILDMWAYLSEIDKIMKLENNDTPGPIWEGWSALPQRPLFFSSFLYLLHFFHIYLSYLIHMNRFHVKNNNFENYFAKKRIS